MDYKKPKITKIDANDLEFIKENNNCNLYGIYCDNQKNTKFKSFYTDNGIILIEK